jgi:predicted 3-demethylubiquinone-9 3-methyltransferase (glyoxalase superfamily)
MKNPIYPCFWFDNNAKEAAVFYRSVFLGSTSKQDNPFVVSFQAGGQKLMFLNATSQFGFNSSISIFVVCESNDEIEHVWHLLAEGGKVLMPLDRYPWSEKYGWVQDQYGLSWQLMMGKMSDVGQKFTPLLMFVGENAGKAEEAIKFYTSVFEDSKIQGISRYEKGEGDVEGFIKHAQYNLGKYVMMAMDSSMDHKFSFNEAVSLVVECDTQDEIDYYWNKLTEGGEESMCGWCKDKYGVSWQVVPTILPKLLGDPVKAAQVTNVFMKMRKFNIEELVNA